MKGTLRTTILCALVCYFVPLFPVQSQSGYQPAAGPAVKPAAKSASLVADSTGSGFIVIDSAGYENGTYVLQLDLRDDGWALKTLTAVNLSGQPARPVPKPDVPDEPEPEPGLPDNETLANIQAKFAESGELDLFQTQLKLMKSALDLPPNMADVTAMHAWVQRGFYVALSKRAEFWLPWTDWYNSGAKDVDSADDYRTWVELSLESLK